ncbi:hypothetical protein EHS13_04410 [Paenibacillus psychroresistens]|uniref:Uncharacterized protein n=1 Tax=Paenibacillus psychroresistens TaxID=1778678 RepID=A0A6B8RFA3_9BACL|nr:hypothetical protein [Paenibacillus psychroresistens]QGQ94203.1 hypothetical protein EHS13_04410 [Paenibacillus psychroresistens]
MGLKDSANRTLPVGPVLIDSSSTPSSFDIGNIIRVKNKTSSQEWNTIGDRMLAVGNQINLPFTEVDGIELLMNNITSVIAPPVITLNGNSYMRLQRNALYSDLGATASYKGIFYLESSIVVKITNSSGEEITAIDTAEGGNYTYTYTLTVGNEDFFTTRSVYVEEGPTQGCPQPDTGGI